MLNILENFHAEKMVLQFQRFKNEYKSMFLENDVCHDWIKTGPQAYIFKI